MSDENAPPLSLTPSAPPDDGGADELISFVDSPAEPRDSEAREAYAAECADDDAFSAGAPYAIAAPVATAETDGAGAGREVAAEDGEEEESILAKASDHIGPHLDELRRRLVISAAAFIPAFAFGLFLYRPLWDLMLLPLADASPHLLRFQALAPSDGLILMMQIAFAFALIVSTPVWISQVWSFVAPGLTGLERRWLYLSLGSGGALFFIGVLVAYFFAVPLALGYLLPLNQSLTGWENSFTGSGYVGFVLTCCVAFGVAFELPLVMLVLGWVGLLSPEGIKPWWRVITLAIFVLAAIMTPPDPFSQLMLALPMLGLFWLGYFLVKWVHWRMEKRQ